ncbi:MAG: nucleoside hydrolase [Clostridiales bacterium]|nr:nucleoside hydrolase [Clostridiales bacterium]
MPKKINIWMDCDPGIDDAIALAMAAASRDRLSICGISTVAGNQSTDLVTDNALKLTSFFHMEEVPVARGARKPLVREVEEAEHIHGKTGLGDCVLPETTKNLVSESGVFYTYQRIMALPEGEKITLVPTGPLTNIALLLRTFPDVAEKIDQIVLMGGASKEGNATPAAEFNIWTDPEAAQMVFQSGLPIVMCGLDVTNQSGLTRQQIMMLCASESHVERACGEMLRFYLDAEMKAQANADVRFGEQYTEVRDDQIQTTRKEKADTLHNKDSDLTGIHDAVTILYLTNPELFHGEYVTVDVECSWSEGRGTTVCRKVGLEETLKSSEVVLEKSDEGVCAKSGGMEKMPKNKKQKVLMLNQVNLSAFQKVLLGKLRTLSDIVDR